MQKNVDFRYKQIRILLIAVILASLFSLTAMFFYATQKTIIVSDEELSEVEIMSNAPAGWELDLERIHSDETDYISITLPAGEKGQDVDCSVRYDDNLVTMVIKNTRQTFFLTDPPKGNLEYVDKLEGYFDSKDTTVSFSLKETCMVETSYYNSEVRVKLIPMSENDKPVVMLDPGHGGSQTGTRVGELSEKDVVLSIANKVSELTQGKPYLVLLTRNADETLKTENRLRSIENTNASLYIGLQLDSDADDTKKFGLRASYNPNFYHAGLENVELADMILRNTAESSANKALGLSEATDEELILKVLDIPAANLYAGYMSNADEASLLEKDAYINKIAEGIVAALDSIYKEE